MRRTLVITIILLLAAIVAAMTMFKDSSYDMWFHLKTGEYILQHKTVPTHDVFSFTAEGRPWVTHEWLFEVFTYLAWKLAAINGVMVFKTLIVLLAFAFTLLTMRLFRVSYALAAPLVILAAYEVTFRAFARPHVVSEALLAVYLYILLAFKYGPPRMTNNQAPITNGKVPHSAIRIPHSALLWLLPLQLLWANLHSGLLFGLGLVGMFIASEFIQGRLARRLPWLAQDALPGKDLVFLLKLLAGLTAISFLNPNFHNSVLYPFLITGSPVFSRGIMELQSPLLRMYWQSDFFPCLLILLIAGLASFFLPLLHRPAARNPHSENSAFRIPHSALDLSHLVIFLIFAAMALKALRNLPVFGLVAAPLIAINLRAYGDRLRRRGETLALGLAALVTAAVLVIVFVRGARTAGEYRKPGLGIDERSYPVEAAEFIAGQPIVGDFFNTMEFGGYLIWRWFPERKVFIDGRLDIFGDEFFNDYAKIIWSSPVFDSVVQRYNLTGCLVAQPADENPNYLGRTLSRRPDWTLVYWDRTALVYLRNIPENRGFIEANSCRTIAPVLLGTVPAESLDARLLLEESQRAVRLRPGLASSHTMCGTAYYEIEDYPNAIRSFQQALAITPGQRTALEGLAQVYVAQHNLPALIATLQQMADADPRSAMPLFNLALAHFQSGNSRRAEEILLKAQRLEPGFGGAYNLLGDVYASQQRYAEAERQWRTALRIDPGDPIPRARLERLR